MKGIFSIKTYREKFVNNLMNFLPIVILLVIFILSSIYVPGFLKAQNFINVSKQIAVIGVLSVGMTLTILSGGIDLSVGSMLALSICIGTLSMKAGLPAWVTILIILISGTVLGLINGLLIIRLSVMPLIVTLATYTIYRGFSVILTGGNTFANIPAGMMTIGLGFIPISLLVIVWFASIFLTISTRFGRNIFSIGGNEQAALFSGINVNRYKVYIYTISGFLSAYAGVIYVGRTGLISPLAGTGYEFEAIAAVVIGGTYILGGEGGIFRTIIGTLVMGFLWASITMIGVDPNWQGMLSGGVIILAISLDSLKRFKK